MFAWWTNRTEPHVKFGSGPGLCPCLRNEFCGSIGSLWRWLAENGVTLPESSLRQSGRGFTANTADAIACAAGVHPSMWWPEWWNSVDG